jgi:hypothetical protein
LGHVASRATVATSRSVRVFSFRSRLGYVVVGFAERAAGAAAREPGVDTGSVECVTAGEATDIVVVFKSINADCTAVAGCAEHFQWCGSPDRVVIVFVLRERVAAVLLVDAGCCLGSLKSRRIRSVLVLAYTGCRRLLATSFGMRMVIPRHIQCGASLGLFTLPSVCSRNSSLFDAASTARRCSNTAHSR